MSTLLDVLMVQLYRVNGCIARACEDESKPPRFWFSLNRGPFIPFLIDLTSLGLEDGDVARAVDDAAANYDPTIMPQIPFERFTESE